MYHQARLYDLSFASREREAPQIIFTIQKQYLAAIMSRIDAIVRHTDAEKYCDRPVHFDAAVPDLFGNRLFGYGGCGALVLSDEETSFRISLCEEHLHNAVLTIHILTHALLGDVESSASNRRQQVDLETHCAHAPHGHSVGGYVSGDVREWLRKEWHKGPHDNWMQWAPMPREVIAAMERTWCAVASAKLRRWAKECSGSITEDGRFILNCFGDACDIAIYPDNLSYEDADGSVRFSCHNLDGARQQLTLLAGLAKICELARSEDASAGRP
jgi:hypothetical protein